MFKNNIFLALKFDNPSLFNSENRDRNPVFHSSQFDIKSRYRFHVGIGFSFTAHMWIKH
jgi:hypothetical protein